jgi:hypothetical protein
MTKNKESLWSKKKGGNESKMAKLLGLVRIKKEIATKTDLVRATKSLRELREPPA